MWSRFLPALVLSAIAFDHHALNPDSLCARQQHVYHTLVRHHFSPPVFNASTNTGVVDIFIQHADERNIFFLGSDRETLISIVNEVPAPMVFCRLADNAAELFRRRLSQIDSILIVFENSELALDGKDSLTFVSPKKGRILCRDMYDLSKRIEKRIKYECLQELVLVRANSTQHLLAGDILGEQKRKAEARAIRKLRRILLPLRHEPYLLNHIADCMSNAIALRCDPHSNYFNSKGLNEYNAALSVEESSFGFHAEANDSGAVVVTEIVAGGPAWKDGKLKCGDIISAFRLDDEEPACLDSCGPEAFLEKLYTASGQSMTIELRRGTNHTEVVRLKAETLTGLSGNVSSYVMRRGTHSIGYIPVHSFYTGGKGCTHDVAREIIGMQKDSVNGLLIDLRFNGGGSMREAIALAGLFINEGAVAIYHPGKGDPFPLKDIHRGTLWDGPVVVLVNAASASASEFFSAAMQDHNRAIITGAATFGKGTAQNVMPADTTYQEAEHPDAGRYGYIKVTAGKFYRTSGAGVQASGIIPDIPLPGITGQIMEKELEQPYALGTDSIAARYLWPNNNSLPRTELLARSRKRTGDLPAFTLLNTFTDSLENRRRTEEKVALSLTDFNDYASKQRYFQSRLSFLLGSANASLLVSPSEANLRMLAIRGLGPRDYAENVELIGRDLVLNESVNILADLIQLSQKK
jgi:carboxyl-terminal processing protease